MAPRTAEIIAVGSELLGSTRTDTNSLYLSGRLAELGIDLRIKSVVGDEREDLATVLRQALDRTDLVVLTGGLGPTDDDLTRDVVSEVLGLPMDARRIDRREDSRAVRGARPGDARGEPAAGAGAARARSSSTIRTAPRRACSSITPVRAAGAS